MFVLSLSHDMNDALGDQTRLEVSKKLLSEIIEKYPPGTNFGLRVFGRNYYHSLSTDTSVGCKDIELVAGIGDWDKQRLKAAVSGFQAQGWRPVAAALDETFGDFQPDQENFVVLIIDGEDECGGDIGKAADRLAENGVTLYIVSLVDQSEVIQTRYKITAESTGGVFTRADTNTAYISALFEILNEINLDPNVHFATQTPSDTPSPSTTKTVSPTITKSPTPSRTATETITPSSTPSPTNSMTPPPPPTNTPVPIPTDTKTEEEPTADFLDRPTIESFFDTLLNPSDDDD
jgi:hypothetical protein